MERLNAWNKYDEDMKKKVFDFADEYRRFISLCKTERECVEEGVRILKASGYKDLKDVIAADEKLKAGDKVYAVNMNKAIVAFNIGEDSIESGMNILGAHIDSPRLDIKQNPLYEETGLDVDAIKLIAVQDRNKHNTPIYAYGICKVFVLCKVVGGSFKKNNETIETNYFSLEDIPKNLANEKTSLEQIKLCFKANNNPNFETYFD